VNTTVTIDKIRAHYDAQLAQHGFKAPARRTVWFPPGNSYYDVLLVSRHPVGVDLWNKTSPEEQDPQLRFDDPGVVPAAAERAA
jgi:hypothetical protein